MPHSVINPLGEAMIKYKLKVNDLEKSKKFYKAIIDSLGFKFYDEGSQYFGIDELYVTEDVHTTQKMHLSFKVKNQSDVKKFYKRAIKNGGICNGVPANRKLHPGFYSAYVVDPDGNQLEAIFEGIPSTRPHVDILYLTA